MMRRWNLPRVICLLLMVGLPAVASPAEGPLRQSATSADWSQHAHDAQHTSYAPEAVDAPWRWKWSWNGPDASGGVSEGKTSLPRGVQPVTGGGRVYIARGADGITALDGADGTEVWTANPGGAVDSTAAFDADTGAVFVVSTDGTLYKLDADSGDLIDSFASEGASDLPLPPAVEGEQVFFAMGDSVYALRKTDLALVWAYAAGSEVHTPPAYSPSRNAVIVASEDLYVHAIDNTRGENLWRVKHTPLSPGDPGDINPHAQVSYGWPVIAEAHGYVLVKLRLNWNTLWHTYEPDNTLIRQFLEANPEHQALLVMDLDDGSRPFIANIGNGGFGNGGYIPMGFQPVIRQFAGGSEVAYGFGRGETRYDPRADSHLVELVLDNVTADGFLPGYFRYVDFAGTTIGPGDVFITDEQPFLSGAGDYLFANHWEVSMYSLRIINREGDKGTYTNRIQTQTLPTLIESQDAGGCNHTTHFITGAFANSRVYPNPQGGFHIYCNQGAVYDQYWSGYAATIIGAGMLITVSTSGSVVALESR